ncbi:hypothetical protein P3G55_13150 [Leptospira sp. 96542]|nr:hypothetical protein [Leptospira sp. 96542]
MKISIQFILSHLFAYIFVSIPYYQWVLKVHYVGEAPVFARFLLTEAAGALWSKAIGFLFPSLFLQSLLILVFLFMIWDFFVIQSFWKQFSILIWIRVVLCGVVSISPAVGNLEGLVFMIPEVSVQIHSLVFLEILLQGLVHTFSFLIFYRWSNK